MKIGDQRGVERVESSTGEAVVPRCYTVEQNTRREHGAPTESVNQIDVEPRSASSSQHSSPIPSPHPPSTPHHEPTYYSPDSRTALLRHINTSYPPIIHLTLHIGMLVRDLHGQIAECHAWCEAAVDAGMGAEPAIRGTLEALGRLRFVVPRGVGRGGFLD